MVVVVVECKRRLNGLSDGGVGKATGERAVRGCQGCAPLRCVAAFSVLRGGTYEREKNYDYSHSDILR